MRPETREAARMALTPLHPSPYSARHGVIPEADTQRNLETHNHA